MTDDKLLNFEELIKLACEKSIDKEVEEMIPLSETVFVSEKTERKFVRRINYLLFKNSRLWRNIKKTAVVCLAVLLLVAAMAITVEPVRVFFTRIYEKTLDNYCELVIQPPKEEETSKDTFEIILPQLDSDWIIENRGTYEVASYNLTSYIGEKVIYSQRIFETNIMLDDCEVGTKEEVVLEKGKIAYIYDLPNGFRTIVYVKDYIFKFSGHGISRETLIELVNSLNY